jgi:hypothetical protein
VFREGKIYSLNSLRLRITIFVPVFGRRVELFDSMRFFLDLRSIERFIGQAIYCLGDVLKNKSPLTNRRLSISVLTEIESKEMIDDGTIICLQNGLRKTRKGREEPFRVLLNPLIVLKSSKGRSDYGYIEPISRALQSRPF